MNKGSEKNDDVCHRIIFNRFAKQMIDKKVVLPCCYLPPISFWSILLNSHNFEIEQHENFVKSTFRNRCEVAGTNGLLKLSVPVLGGKSHRQLFKDTRIANENRWQKIHWQTLCSAYRRSAYFEYYEDKFAPFYHQEFEFLFDFNFQLLALIASLLKIENDLNFTNCFQKTYDNSTLDFRNHFKSLQENTFGNLKFEAPNYFQCFGERTGFLPNLSVVDILFSEGPHAATKIKQAIGVNAV